MLSGQELRGDGMMVHLSVDDARTAQAAGATFARALAGADAHDFAAALAEQEHLVQRAITDAGYTVLRADLAAREFAASAAVEWQRIVNAGSNEAWDTA